MFMVIFSFTLVKPLQAQKDSLDLMIGQMILIGIENFYNTDQRNQLIKAVGYGQVGGIILYEKDLMPIDTRRELGNMIWTLQEKSDIPLFISIDEEGGLVNRLKPKYGFPATVSAQTLGKWNHRDSTLKYAGQIALNLHKLGINLNYAPVLDVNVNSNNPVIGKLGRSFSSDWKNVAQQAGWFIEAHDQYRIGTVLKHFPGHGSSDRDTHLGVADVSESWQIAELFPYQQLIDSGLVKGVMTAHIVNRSLDPEKRPATLSPWVIDQMLRNILKYDGVVFSDDMHMGAIRDEYGFKEATINAINAGVDVLLYSNNIGKSEHSSAAGIHQIIKNAVLDGDISVRRIEQSYLRIMRLKSQLGLLEDDYKEELNRRLKDLN
jgi:beta-N-acetylhexosaminidase